LFCSIYSISDGLSESLKVNLACFVVELVH